MSIYATLKVWENYNKNRTGLKKKTNDFLNKGYLGGGLISSFVILIGLLVVCSSFKLIESFKNYQNMIFKILGLKPKHIIRILLIEVFLISIPIIVSSLLLSTIVSYVFINYIIGLNGTILSPRFF